MQPATGVVCRAAVKTIYATTTVLDETSQVLTIADGAIKTTMPPAPEGAWSFA